MCTSTVQMFFIKDHIIMKSMAGTIYYIMSCKKMRHKSQHKETKRADFLLFPKWQRGEGREVQEAKVKENLWKIRNTTKLNNQ